MKLSLKEKLGYGAGDLACSIIFQFVTLYLIAFYRNLGISYIGISQIILSGLLADIIWVYSISNFVQNIKSKWGKYRPVILLAIVPLSILVLFSIWGAGKEGISTLRYAYITYIGLSLTHSMIAVPYGSLSLSMTRNKEDIQCLAILRMFFSSLGAVVLFVLAPKMKVYMGNITTVSHTRTFIVLYVAVVLMLLMSYLSSKERYINQDKNRDEGLRTIIELGIDKPLVHIKAVASIMLIKLTITGLSDRLFYRYIMEDSTLFHKTVISAIPLIPILILITPMFIERYNKKKLLFLGIVLQIFKPVLLLTKSVVLVRIGSALNCVGIGIVGSMLWIVVIDVIHYNRYIMKRNYTELIYGMVGFWCKAGVIIGLGIFGFALEKSGYVIRAMMQTNATLFAIEGLSSLLPIMLTMTMLYIISRYELTDDVMDEVEEIRGVA